MTRVGPQRHKKTYIVDVKRYSKMCTKTIFRLFTFTKDHRENFCRQNALKLTQYQLSTKMDR